MSDRFFSPDFATARRLFLDAAANADSELHQLPLHGTDPQGLPLGIDIAWLGSRKPHRALVHVSGIHGVEGFAGSAVQLAQLAQRPDLPPDCALILVHVLNPYGMANLRRGNANNVDLNRNFFVDGNGWQDRGDDYAALDALLNPPSPPARFSLFYLHLLRAETSLGSSAIRQAVAGGQYLFPKGIFYGGQGLEPELQRYRTWLSAQLSDAQELVVIDVHTGLGDYGQQTLFLRSTAMRAHEVGDALQMPIASAAIESDVMGYAHQGEHSSVYRAVLPAARTVCLTQEFGTYGPRRLLRALRAENQYHHFGNGQPGHWSKRQLKRMFCPEDREWRNQVIAQGCELVQRAADMLFLDRQLARSAPT